MFVCDKDVKDMLYKKSNTTSAGSEIRTEHKRQNMRFKQSIVLIL